MRIKINLTFFIICAGLIIVNPAQNILKPDNNRIYKSGSTKEIILAKVGNKTITVKEFYERSEYTIRPPYAKGNSELEKKIILNSLIAEKLLAIEKEKESELFDQKLFRQKILGRKEQKMRQLLFYQEGYNKAGVDSSKFVTNYKLAGREYDIEFINIKEKYEADYITKQLIEDSLSLEKVYNQLTEETKLPSYKLKWNSPEYPQVAEILYNKENPEIGKVYGPIKLAETYLFFQVKGWTDKPAISHNEQTLRYSNVKEKLLIDDAVNHYAGFIKTVMKGKTLNFNKNTFFKLVKIFAPVYQKDINEKKEEFADKNLKETQDISKKILKLEGDLESLASEALMNIDGQVWTVKMFTEEIQKHPLVFRNKNFAGKDFPKHFQLAIIDLIRDKYLTQEAYNRKLDQEYVVERVERMWTDALVSFYEQTKILSDKKAKEFLTPNIVQEIFTPYIDELQKKYSDVIEINIEEFVKLKLTRVDMFAVEKNVPYPIIVPAFPNITTDYHLEYGKKMNINDVESK